MAKATLMVFILEQLPGFSEVLNLTFDVLTRTNPDIFVSHLQYCDPTLAEPILGVVNQQFLKINPPYNNVITPVNKEIDLSAYDETLDAINYAKNLKEMEISKSVNANHQALLELANVTFKEKIKLISNTSVLNNVLPVRQNSVKSTITTRVIDLNESMVPLVAIFETLSNVTAQTCGGVLMAPKWVLTSADCLNMLKDFNIAGIKQNDTSIYSVVVGAKNPLEDGKVYNVTDIFVYPNLTRIENAKCDECKKDLRSKVALMKIWRSHRKAAPTQDFKQIHLMTDKVAKDENVTVLGWSMLNGSLSNDIHASFVSGTVSQCPGVAGNETVLCLSIVGDIASQITAGGPVLVVRDGHPRMLALLTAAEDKPYPVALLDTCQRWIADIMNNK